FQFYYSAIGSRRIHSKKTLQSSIRQLFCSKINHFKRQYQITGKYPYLDNISKSLESRLYASTYLEFSKFIR
ncbi:MAG TPA: hypothetical protein ACFCUD_12145, partial [Cyclobacteriaceae bacterium]